MTLPAHPDQPPQSAAWLLTLFASANEAETILGDLLEEFSALVATSGRDSARKWYWRQTMGTVPRLVGPSLRAAPWSTAAVVAGGFLLRRLVGPLVGSTTFSLLDRYTEFFGNHFATFRFFASTGLDIEHLLSFLMIGFVVAWAAREREMTATAMLASIFAAMAVVGSTYAAIASGSGALLWRLGW